MPDAAKTDIDALRRRAKAHEQCAGASNTERAYDRQWAAFGRWCAANADAGIRVHPSDAETIATYLTYLGEVRGLGESTLVQTLSALRYWYRREEGYANEAMHPSVGLTLKSLRRDLAKPPNQKTPLRAADLRAIVAAVESGGATVAKKWIRDKALLLVGWGGGFRRSELIGLRWDEARFEDAAVSLFVPESKTDQMRRGMWKCITRGAHQHTCPVRALEAWRATTPEVDGWIFASMRGEHGPLDDSDVNKIIKHYVALIGLPPAKYAGHSLRRGFVTDMTAQKLPETLIMEQLGYKPNTPMVRRYTAKSLLKNEAATRLAGM